MKQSIQYTIRDVPLAVDAKLRTQASRQGISLNKLILSKLGAEKPSKKKLMKEYTDLDWMTGALPLEETRLVDAAIKEARDVDKRRAYSRYQSEMQK